jgi:hypothetical protein
LDLEAGQDWAKDLLLVALHVGLHASQQRGSDEISLWIARDLKSKIEATSITTI